MSLEDGSRIEVNETSLAVIGATHAIDAAKKDGVPPEARREAMIGLLDVLANRPGAIEVLAAIQPTEAHQAKETVLISNDEQAA